MLCQQKEVALLAAKDTKFPSGHPLKSLYNEAQWLHGCWQHVSCTCNSMVIHASQLRVSLIY